MMKPHDYLRQFVPTQAELARKTGWSRAYISDLLAGNRIISAEKANRLATALKLDPASRRRLHKLGAIDAGWEI